MQARVDRDQVSHVDAAARLRYLSDVQQRVRRASLAPSFALLVLGVVAIFHGVLAGLWPGAHAVQVIWLGAVIAVRPVLRALRRRIELRRGLQTSARLPLLCALAAAACVGLAFVTGADPFISAIAAATALAAYAAGLPTVAAAAVAVGLLGDVAIEHGLAPATGQVIVGAGLLAAGLVSLAREREDA